MYIKLDTESAVPLYMQIYSEIRGMIVGGAFPFGSRLPSRRELARDCGVSVITAEHAFQLLGRDKTVALEAPSYPKIREVYEANGAVCEMLAMDGEGIRTDELSRSRASILHVTPFNSFPSHITASAARRQEYLSWAGERNAVIIEDDYDSEFSLTGTAPETLFAQSGGNVIYINTFSKTIAPSLRAGYMILPEALLGVYERTVGFYSCTVPMLEQYFLTEWLDSGEFERNISRVRNRE